ncbi:MAG: hypothetical protein AB1757_16745 [Acidobacteriota bacterium]
MSVQLGLCLRIGDASPASGNSPGIASALPGFNLCNFSNGSLLQTSQINGNVNCAQGVNKFCANPAKVSRISNCGLCPKP